MQALQVLLLLLTGVMLSLRPPTTHDTVAPIHHCWFESTLAAYGKQALLLAGLLVAGWILLLPARKSQAAGLLLLLLQLAASRQGGLPLPGAPCWPS
jgi:hypothetical protein